MKKRETFGALEWKDVTCRLQGRAAPALRRVSFRLSAGVTVVLGESSGLFGPLSVGALAADEGTVYYGAVPVGTMDRAALGRGVILLTGADEPAEGAVSALLGAADEGGRALARALGLHPLILAAGGYQAPAERLSDGGRLLARVAAALARLPRLLILDGLLERLDEDAAERVLETAAARGTDCAALTARECLPRRFARALVFRGDTLVFQGARDEFEAWEEAAYGRDTP